MGEKSLPQHASKKTGKLTLKEKRALKHAKAEAKDRAVVIPTGKRH